MTFRRRIKQLLERITRQTSRWWYEPLLGFLSALDAFVPFVPNEPLLAAGVVAKRQKWLRLSLIMALGSALGALALAAVVGHWSGRILNHFVSGKLLASKSWKDSVQLINHRGWWGLALISISPFPQHAAVIFVGLTGMPLPHVFGAILVGRGVKYTALAWVAERVGKRRRD